MENVLCFMLHVHIIVIHQIQCIYSDLHINSMHALKWFQALLAYEVPITTVGET